jgi:hypothetical protein
VQLFRTAFDQLEGTLVPLGQGGLLVVSHILTYQVDMDSGHNTPTFIVTYYQLIVLGDHE